MVRLLSYFSGHFFGLVYLLFRFLIFSNSGFGNYTKLRVRFNVFVFDLGFLSW
jgi:hypothetical protein